MVKRKPALKSPLPLLCPALIDAPVRSVPCASPVDVPTCSMLVALMTKGTLGVVVAVGGGGVFVRVAVAVALGDGVFVRVEVAVAVVAGSGALVGVAVGLGVGVGPVS